MELSNQVAKQFREVHLDGHWISTNFKEQIEDLSWEVAVKKIGSLNSIAALTYHINYYMSGVLKVLEGGPLDIQDKYSFDLPPISNEKQWKNLISNLLHNAEQVTEHIIKLSDQQIGGDFADGKYGSNYRNLTGMIEHAYYHLGQIVLIKKLIHENYSS